MTVWHRAGLERPPLAQRLGVRLAALLGLGAALSAMLATVAMLAMAYLHTERASLEEAHQVARGVAFALQAPVSFADSAGIRDAVGVLQARPQIHGAWVHDPAGRLLYDTGPALLRPGTADQGSLAQGWLQVSVPITAGAMEDTVGRLTLHVNLDDVRLQLRVQALAAAAAGLVAALLALVVSQRLARRIIVPVVRLARAAAEISRDQNFALRLPSAGRDEVGVAVMAFNAMLDEIERRGRRLVSMNMALQQQAQVAQTAQAQAESASLAKTRFLANMSHELRSPLNGVIGAAQLLLAQGADPVRRTELVDIIRTSGGNLLGLIEHVLDLARIEAGGLTLSPRDFHLPECIEAAVVSSSALAAAKGLRLSCCVDPALAAWRHGDELRLRQLVLNLLGNAVKFTAQGDVTVDVRAVAGRPGWLQIAVRDTGVGIPGEALARVFEPFQQADASTTRRFGGSGLGLAICRDLARLMGGDVSAESVPGVGSCFTLALPLPEAQQPGPADEPLARRVAWCEPHAPSAQALAALLERVGCEAQRCDDLSSLREFMARPDAQGRAPLFIVAVDSEPGRTLLTRALPQLATDQVLAVDGRPDAPPEPAWTARGLPSPMPRPLLRGGLLARLMSAPPELADPADAGTRATAGSDAPGHQQDDDRAAAGAPSAAHVLLVEDDAINQAVVRSMLTHAGYVCAVASHGAAALQQLAGSRYDLVLMDWHMPDMDGLEVTRRLRQGQAGDLNRGVPVVALTANAFAEDRATCLAAGMNDFVTKPVLASHLVAVVRRWSASQEVRPAAAQVASAAPAPAVTAQAVAPDFDPRVLAQLPMVADGSDPGFAEQLLQEFGPAAAQWLRLADAALDRGDHPALLRAVHSLKSAAAQVGALALAEVAGRIETALRQPLPDAEALPAMLAQLRARLRRLDDTLAARGTA